LAQAILAQETPLIGAELGRAPDDQGWQQQPTLALSWQRREPVCPSGLGRVG